MGTYHFEPGFPETVNNSMNFDMLRRWNEGGHCRGGWLFWDLENGGMRSTSHGVHRKRDVKSVSLQLTTAPRSTTLRPSEVNTAPLEGKLALFCAPVLKLKQLAAHTWPSYLKIRLGVPPQLLVQGRNRL